MYFTEVDNKYGFCEADIMCVCESLSCVWLFVASWTIAHQAPLFVEFSRQDDMILYIENAKDSTRKLLELINEYSKVADIKSTHRNPLHSYTLTMR